MFKFKIVDDYDVIFKVIGFIVCGSDVYLMYGVVVQVEKGDILGYEFCGVVELVGLLIIKFVVGDWVVNSFCIFCGECSYCKDKFFIVCEKMNVLIFYVKFYGGCMGGIFGYLYLMGGYVGGQVEYVRILLVENNFFKIFDNVLDEKVLYFFDVLFILYYSVVYIGVNEGDIVVIWGFGFIGFMVCFWVKKKGVKCVIGIDSNWWIEYVKFKILGLEIINYVILEFGQIVLIKIYEMVFGGVDVSIDVSGGEYVKGWVYKLEMVIGVEQDISEMINECLYVIKKFGRVGIIGDYVGFINYFNVGVLMEFGIYLIGCGQVLVQRCKFVYIFSDCFSG